MSGSSAALRADTAPGASVCWWPERIAMRLREHPGALSAHELVRRHQNELEGIEIENNAAAHRVLRVLRELERQGVVTRVPRRALGDPIRFRWTHSED